MFTRKIEIYPAYDKRDTDPKKNYGIHGVTMVFVLRGPKGAISFTLYTNWHLPHVQEELTRKCNGSFQGGIFYCRQCPMPADISYHSPVRTHKYQYETKECSYLDGKPCYSDGSSLMARDVFNKMVAEGEEGLWKELENRYNSQFNKE